ncbi:FkbM family methyltransferase [Chloracidobacterium thermophilum]|uniref:FkbM family methyltransferase n=1 Tax=Chloracidobacterium thermophilum TaxID=458033 RepID=UPI0007389FE2|nr:FkbM family methyltransferase [Chloracidobacterium thermophilum]
MKKFIRQLIEKAGYTVFKTAYAPKQMDVILDIRRLVPLSSVQVIFDVGANVGETVLWFRGAFPHAHIVAFEPVKATFNELERRVGHLPNVKLLNVALGEQPKVEVMHLQRYSGHNSLNPALNQPSPTGQSEEVQVETVQNIAKKLAFPRIDFFKIDTEGYELPVLTGATDYLPKTTFIYAEIDFEINGRHTNFFALHEFLGRHGFAFFGLYDLHHYENGRLNYANALFINPARLRAPVGGAATA